MVSMNMNTAANPLTTPWWKFGYVWLIVLGPAVVIVAGFYTLWLAVSIPDPVIDNNYYRKGVEINKTLNSQPHDTGKNLAPALSDRNHAATPPKDRQ